MTTRQPRFELIRTSAGYTARFRASNGRVLFSTGAQVYSRKRDALNAIYVLAAAVADGAAEHDRIDERSGGAR